MKLRLIVTTTLLCSVLDKLLFFSRPSRLNRKGTRLDKRNANFIGIIGKRTYKHQNKHTIAITMSGPVARWLETFVCTSMCKQYVDVFQEFGYKNLNDVCNLNAQQLLKMGVTRMDTEKIMENVSVLKQTMQATSTVGQSFQGYPTSNHLEAESKHFRRNQFYQGC